MQWSNQGPTAYAPKPGRTYWPRVTSGQIAGLVMAGTGIALLACAWFADVPWFDRHFLPNFFVSRPRQLEIGRAHV